MNLDDFIPKHHEALIIEVIEKIGASKLKPIKDASAKGNRLFSYKSSYI